MSCCLHGSIFCRKNITFKRSDTNPFHINGWIVSDSYGFGFRHRRACHIVNGLENWLTEQCYGMKEYKPGWCFTFTSGTSTAVEMLGQWVYCQVKRNCTQVREKRDVDLKNFIVSLENRTYCLLSNYSRSNRIKVCEEFVQVCDEKNYSRFCLPLKVFTAYDEAISVQSIVVPTLFCKLWWYSCSWGHKPILIVFHSIIFPPSGCFL